MYIERGRTRGYRERLQREVESERLQREVESERLQRQATERVREKVWLAANARASGSYSD